LQPRIDTENLIPVISPSELIERLNGEIKTDVVGIFLNEYAITRLIGAL
jgi:hypothetical protein